MNYSKPYILSKQQKALLTLCTMLILSFGLIIGNLNNIAVFAQISATENEQPLQQQQQNQNMSDTSEKRNTTLGNVLTFNTNGFIRSIITPEVDPLTPYLVYGSWKSVIENKNMTNFEANLTMVRINGTESHTIQITNFEPTASISLQEGPIGSTVIYSGLVDVLLNEEPRWNDVQTVIMLDEFERITIALDSPETNDHFNGQLLDGVVQSVTTPEGKELLLIVMEPAPIIIPAVVPETNETSSNNMTNNG